MTQIPIKLLKDKTQQPFIPYVPAEAVLINNTDLTLVDPDGIMELLKQVPYYDATKVQILMHGQGHIQWMTVEENGD